MNARSLSLVLASLLLTSSALAAAPRRSKKSQASTTSTSAASSSSASSAESSAAPSEPADEPAPVTRGSASQLGTGQLYAGGYAGLLISGSVAPNLGLQVAGPIRLQGLPPKLHLEWIGALDLAFSSDSESIPFGGEVEASAFSVAVLPGGRILVPVVPKVLLHGDLSLGLAFTHASASSSVNGQEFSSSSSEVGAVFRLAAGAIIPVNERLRFNVTPFALQAYTSGGTSWSIQAGLSFALD